jgi:ribosomal protein S1
MLGSYGNQAIYERGCTVEAANSEQTPIQLSDLKRGSKLTGQVTKIDLAGAFVDVGAECEGLIHISRLNRGHVNRVEDAIKAGEQVEVWVEICDPNAKRLELTMIRPVTVKWGDIKSGAKFSGQVVRLEKFGAFVDIGAERPGLLHVSEMQDEYVNDPSEFVSVGETVEVTVLDVDRSKRQFRLSMKQAAYEIEEEEVEEEIPTAMEIALREAMEEPEKDIKTPELEKTSTAKGNRGELDDIFARTLENKLDTSASKDE